MTKIKKHLAQAVCAEVVTLCKWQSVNDGSVVGERHGVDELGSVEGSAEGKVGRGYDCTEDVSLAEAWCSGDGPTGPSLAATVENCDVVSNLAQGNCKRIKFEMDLEREQKLLGRLICMALTEVPPGLESGGDGTTVYQN